MKGHCLCEINRGEFHFRELFYLRSTCCLSDVTFGFRCVAIALYSCLPFMLTIRMQSRLCEGLQLGAARSTSAVVICTESGTMVRCDIHITVKFLLGGRQNVSRSFSALTMPLLFKLEVNIYMCGT